MVRWGSQVNKQAMYMVPKSANESRAHYAPGARTGRVLSLVLHASRHKICHFGDVLPSQSLDLLF